MQAEDSVLMVLGGAGQMLTAREAVHVGGQVHGVAASLCGEPTTALKDTMTFEKLNMLIKTYVCT